MFITLFLSYFNLVTLDLPSMLSLFQVFLFDFLWEAGKSDGPLTVNNIGEAEHVQRTK